MSNKLRAKIETQLLELIILEQRLRDNKLKQYARMQIEIIRKLLY
jgi:hypothetical protein